ncbi:MAG: N-acetylglucosamine-6-phosphate deacetylase [Firmicutes bacterium]|nr:N-acetylglucosamine-6-phosphate deacetylase [Bacillota bacterium]
MKAIVNANLVVDQAVLEGKVLVFDAQIRAICDADEISLSAVDEVIDGAGCFVAPGFIDVHVHGFGGAQVLDVDSAGLATMSRLLPSTGVTAFLATTMAESMPRLTGVLANIRAAMTQGGGASVLGCHLEGPFINEQVKGAHEAQFIAPFSSDILANHADVIRLVTVAPELAGGADFIKQCRQLGIQVSVGHTAATFEQGMAAVESGASLFTHVFNAMPPLHHRQPGALGAALDSDAYCELIADNVHVHPAIQRLLLRAKGVERIILITDSTMAGLPDGTYQLNGQTVTVQDNAVRLSSGRLAGSALTLNMAVRNFMANTGLELPYALRTVTANPAQLLGLAHRKGQLAVSLDADLVILDGQLDVRRTFVRGECMYRE